MSKIFEDSKFEEMDWLEQVISPYKIPLVEMFANLPSSVEVTAEDIKIIQQNGVFESSNTLIRSLATRYPEFAALINKDGQMVNELDYILLHLKVTISGEPIYDRDSNTLTGGTITLEKTANELPDKTIKQMIIKEFCSDFRYTLNIAENVKTTIKILFPEADLKDIKYLGRFRYCLLLNDLISNAILDDVWRFRSLEPVMALKASIIAYCNKDIEDALGDIYRFKVMADTPNGIYSFETRYKEDSGVPF